MALGKAEAHDVDLLLSDDEDEDEEQQSRSQQRGRAPPRRQPQQQLQQQQQQQQTDGYGTRHANDEEREMESELQLRQQISQQLQPLHPQGNVVQRILDQIRPNASDEVSVDWVIDQLAGLPCDSKISMLIELLSELGEQYAPKDAIMSIWFKLTHPKRSVKRVQSAGPMPILRSRLLETKRKQAECDLQLLQNRISLLQQEESKAWKKIVQTKGRAQEILELREAKLKKKSDKSNLALSREKQTRSNQKRQHSLKKESVIKKKHAAIQIISKKYQDVELVKTESKRLKAEKEAQQRLAVEQAREKREAVRRQEEALKKKRDDDRRQHEQHVALRYMKKVIDEERRIKEQQRQVEEMERHERELIQRLQGTQLIQKEAFGVLEQALLGVEQRPATASGSGSLQPAAAAGSSPLRAPSAMDPHTTSKRVIIPASHPRQTR